MCDLGGSPPLAGPCLRPQGSLVFLSPRWPPQNLRQEPLRGCSRLATHPQHHTVQHVVLAPVGSCSYSPAGSPLIPIWGPQHIPL